MNKFDNILKQYITELNVDPVMVGKNLASKIGTPDQQTKNALNVVSAIAQSGDKDVIHQGLMKVIDPESKETFSDIFKSESEKAKALERLEKMGIPIGSVKKEQTPQQTQQQNSQQTQQQTNQSEEESTVYGGQTYGV